jgi:hypothetical protein
VSGGVKILAQCVSGAMVLAFCLSAQPAQTASEQKKRVGNWYYISGTDRMFKVPRFVGAVHDTQARSILTFTCQVRPGVRPGKKAKPMMGMTLSVPVGPRGEATPVKLRLDRMRALDTRWVTDANGESTFEHSARTDPLTLLSTIARRHHRRLIVESRALRLQFDLEGADEVLTQMRETCVKPTSRNKVKARKRRSK